MELFLPITHVKKVAGMGIMLQIGSAIDVLHLA